MANLFVKKGDTVVVIAGKEKGKTAKVLEVSPKDNRVLVENVNVVTKHQKQRSQEEKGGIIKKSAPIDASNVMVICPSCGKATRVGHKLVDGKKVRVCKHADCLASLDKEMSKKVKKQAKDAKKADNTTKKSEKVEKNTSEKVKKSTEKKTTKKSTAKKADAKVEE